MATELGWLCAKKFPVQEKSRMTVQKTRHNGGIKDCTAEEQVTTSWDENLVLQDETQISRDETFVLQETNNSLQFKS